MNIQLSDHFTTGRLLRFALPSIAMMIFMSFYGVVDGIFVSNFTGSTAFASLNLVWPYIMVLGGLGFMIGTGGSALVAYRMGQGEQRKANETFSLLILTAIFLGIALTVFGELTLRPVVRLLGASEDMVPHCMTYGRIMLAGLTPFLLQGVFQSFMVTAERPRLGLWVTVAAGIANIAFDYLFMGPLCMGVAGAALGTTLSECVGGLVPLIYFLVPNSSPLGFCKTHFDGPALRQTMWNGASEFVTNISMSLVNILYNWQLMRIIGENGVAAYGVLQYVAFFFVSIYIGYSMGTAPIVSYHYGAENHGELQNLFRKSLTFIALAGVSMLTLSQVLAVPLANIFMSYDLELRNLTAHAFRLFSMAFLVSGFNIYGSDFFTALNNGKVSATISFTRTILFECSAVLLLPRFMGLNGVWVSLPTAELLAVFVTAFFLWKNRKKYRYI